MDLYDELLELVLAYSNNQVKYLAKWIIDYNRSDNRRELDQRLEKQLYIKRFRRMADAFELVRGRGRAARSEELSEYYSNFIKPMIPNKHRYGVDELCFKENWSGAASAVADLDGEIEAGKFEREFERLVTDTEYLIGQLIRVMKIEYSKRLERAKKALGEYLDPHRALLERLAKNLEEANESLRRMEASGLSPDDKSELGRMLAEKIGEMRAIESRETAKARDMIDFVSEMRKSHLIFESLIASIERKKGQIEERKGYMGVLERLEIETSEMDSLFSDLSGELARNTQKAKESIDLLTSAFQERILDIISDQEKVNRILETSGQRELRWDEAGAAENKHDYYEEILKILKTMNG